MALLFGLCWTVSVMQGEQTLRRGVDLAERQTLEKTETTIKGCGDMAGYVRKTSLSPAEVLDRAGEALPERIGLSRSKGSAHAATFAGAEGTVTLNAHRHSLYTEVTAQTDQLRTSRMDYEIQKFLNLLPYEAGDVGGPGSGEYSGPSS